MADTPENRVKKKATTLLKSLDAYYFFPATGGYGRSGVPDIVGSYMGKFFGIECKKPGGKVTALQQRELDNITASGGVAFMYDGTMSDNTFLELLGAGELWRNMV
jgi:hypothetical protein